jgi:hypothetical protein
MSAALRNMPALLQSFCFLLPRRHQASPFQSFSGFSVPIKGVDRGINSFSLALRLAIKLGYFAVALPKLNMLAVDKLLWVFDGGAIVTAVQHNASYDVVVVINDVDSIITHLRQPCRRNSHNYAITGIE